MDGVNWVWTEEMLLEMFYFGIVWRGIAVLVKLQERNVTAGSWSNWVNIFLA